MEDPSCVAEKTNYSAYIYWWHFYWRHKNYDHELKSILAVDFPSQKNGLRFCRKGLMLSSNELARRLRISTSAYSRIERDFEFGKVTLAKAKQVAEVMDCELIYAVRPKKRIPFSEMIWSALAKVGRTRWSFQRCPPNARDRRLASIGRNLQETASFRSQQKWTKRKGFSGKSD